MFVGQLEYYLSFANLKKIHKPISVQDFLEINAICSASIAAITTGAAAIAPYGAAVHAGCANNKFLKNPKSQALLNALWTAPEFDPLKGEIPHPSPPAPAAEVLPSAERRLQQKQTAKQSLEESLAQIAATRASLEELKKATSVPEAGNTEADTRLAILRLQLGDLGVTFLDHPWISWQLDLAGKCFLNCQDQMVTLYAKLGLKIHSCSTPAVSMAWLQAHLQLWWEQICKI